MSFNIIKNNCYGLDVHKTWIFSCIGITDSHSQTEYKQALFSSFIRPADIRELRDPVRYRYKLTCMITVEKNRAQNCLTVSNLKFDDIFSDVFGKSFSFYYRTDFTTPRGNF